MQQTRRQFLQSAGGILALLAGAGFPGVPQAYAEGWDRAAFEAKDFEQVMRMLGAESGAVDAMVEIVAPDIAENGAVVPIGVTSRLPGTQAIAVVVEKNPNPLAALFAIPAGTLPELQTRVKMAQTCSVFVLVNADGALHYASKEIKVTVGGCGG